MVYLQRMFNFNGTTYKFTQYFYAEKKLFERMTINLSNSEFFGLTVDPSKCFSFAIQISRFEN